MVHSCFANQIHSGCGWNLWCSVYKRHNVFLIHSFKLTLTLPFSGLDLPTINLFGFYSYHKCHVCSMDPGCNSHLTVLGKSHFVY